MEHSKIRINITLVTYREARGFANFENKSDIGHAITAIVCNIKFLKCDLRLTSADYRKYFFCPPQMFIIH